MKKYLLLILISFMSISSFSQTDSSSILDKIKTLPKQLDTSSTFKQMYGDVKQAIQGIAKGLKVGAEHVYIILVRQQVVRSIVYLIMVLLTIYFLKSWLKAYKNKEEHWVDYDSDPTFIGVFRVVQLIISVILLGISIFNIDTIITGFVNPEYGAITDIMEFISDHHK